MKEKKRVNKEAEERLRCARRREVANYICKGFTIREMCEKVGDSLGIPTVSTSVIHRDITALCEQWQEEAREIIAVALPLELARIAKVEAAAWEDYELSRIDPITGARRPGDPRYLAEITKQHIERRKLLGLYAAQKIESKSEEVQMLKIEVSSPETAEALRALRELRPQE